MKKLIKELKKDYRNIDINIFRSVEEVNLDTIISYKTEGVTHHFLDDYYTRKRNKEQKFYDDTGKYKSIEELDKEVIEKLK